MDEKAINDKLFEFCQDTVNSITEKELRTVKPKQFIEHTDAAACNLQGRIDFNQDEIIMTKITQWARYILSSLATGQTLTIEQVLGKYLDIHVEVPFNTKEMPVMKHAMMEVVALYEDDTLSTPIATRILIAGLQPTLHEQRALNGPDPNVDTLLLSLSSAISGVTLPYEKAQLPILREQHLD